MDKDKSPKCDDYKSTSSTKQKMIKIGECTVCLDNYSSYHISSFEQICQNLEEPNEKFKKTKFFQLEMKGSSNYFVKLGYNTEDNILYAIKCLTKKPNEEFGKIDPKTLIKYLSEINNMEKINKLKSESFVKMNGYYKNVDEFNNIISLNIVMEECIFSLSDYLRSIRNISKSLDEIEKKDIFNSIFIIIIKIKQAISELRAFKHIHSDLKLENILISKKGTIKLADFSSLLNFKEFSSVCGGQLQAFTKGYIPKCFSEEGIFLKGNICEEDFLNLDYFSFYILLKKFLHEIAKIPNCLLEEQKNILEKFEEEFIPKDIENLSDLSLLEIFADGKYFDFLRENEIALKNQISLSQKLILNNLKVNFSKTKFSNNTAQKNQEENVARKLVNKYIQIGFYQLPLDYCLIMDGESLESLIILGKIWSILKNTENCKFYLKKYLELTNDKNNDHTLFAESEIRCGTLSMPQKDKSDNEFIIDNIFEKLKMKGDINLYDTFSLDLLINIIFIYYEARTLKKAEIAIDYISSLIKSKHPSFKPDYEKSIENDKNFLRNYFYYKFYNLMALVIVQDEKRELKISKQNDPFKLMENSLKLAKTIFFENTSNIAQIYNNFGIIFSKNGKYPTAISYHEKSFEIRLKLYGASSDISLIWVHIPVINLIRCLYDIGDCKKSLDVSLKACNDLSQANLLTNETLMTLQLKENIMKCFFKLNNFVKAKEFYDDLKQILENSSTKNIGKFDLKTIENVWSQLYSEKHTHA